MSLSEHLVRKGGFTLMPIKGGQSPILQVKLALAPVSSNFAAELQFKQHPNVAKFTQG
jgi:coatomer subunit delta